MTLTKCASCGYPLTADHIGQTITCPMCSSVNEAIAQGVTLPDWVFYGGLGVLVGIILAKSKYIKEQRYPLL